VLIVAALAPLWLVGIFGRQLWTPDEPREADIAWRMSQQQDRSLPLLAGTPFLEKPPLTYWLSAAGITAFGDHAAAARAPNLLYAILSALAVGALACAMGVRSSSALLAALVAGSALITYRVSAWLAPDAALLGGNALALLGAWYGYSAAPGLAKLRGYTLMHAGAVLGFMAKSAPGWLVPALALAVLITWERRWQELRRPELYAGLILQVLVIGPWVWSVARAPAGMAAVRVLLWNNSMGRFAHLSAPPTLDYANGHPNSPGKYLLELPVYLLPWTLAAAAALACAWRRRAAPPGAAISWRFALAASLPWLALLSLAATARDVYAAPAVLGFALLIALWAEEAQQHPTPLDLWCVGGTVALVAVLAAALLAALAVLTLAGALPAAVVIAAAVAIALPGTLLLVGAQRARRQRALCRSLTMSYTAYALTVSLSALVAFPVIDRWQDLGALARRIHRAAQARPLALLAPDETTLAVIDREFKGSGFQVLESGGPAQVQAWFAAQGADARVLVLLPGHAPGDVSRWLTHRHPLHEPGDGNAATLISADVARLVQRYELPQGRRYALLGPPDSPTFSPSAEAATHATHDP
jgi:4-amino-4-deoxy-L-arabinose transferase-like glycosyltransferase